MSDETSWKEPTPHRDERSASSGSIELIKADIERTQAELADTLEELQFRLHPRRLIVSAGGAARGYATRWARTVTDVTVRGAAVGTVHALQAGRRVRQGIEARPTSAVLIGSGLASLVWLWVTRRGGGRHRRRIV